MVVHMQHDVNIRTAIADIDDPIGGNAQALPEFLQYRNLAAAGGHAPDGTNFAGASVEFEFGTVNALRRHDAVECRNDDFARRCGYHEKRKTIPFGAALHEVHQRGNRTLEADAAPRLHQMLAAHAAKFRIVTNQVRKLAALLHQIAARKPGHSLLESGYSQQFA